MLQIDKSRLRQSMPKDPIAARREYAGPALFSYGFRPFFLFGATWAALAVPIWIYDYAAGGGAIGGAPALAWHVHEMLFGVIGAIMAGFMLTAVPNWTGRLPVMGAPLMALAALWAAGRLAMLFYGALGVIAASLDSSFLVVLAGLMWREVLTGGNKKNAPVCALASLLALTNIGFHIGFHAHAFYVVSERVAIGAIAMMIALIGGRIIPSFTRNWMAEHKLTPLPAPFGLLDKVAFSVAGLALLSWAFAPSNIIVGCFLVLAGALHTLRLARWRGWMTVREPLVLILHIGYAWLPVAFFLMGAAALAPDAVLPFAALHALTAGAMGTMTLAVMTRASLGHTGRARTADIWTVTIYALVVLGAIVRVLAPIIFVRAYIPALSAAAFLWSGAYALFTVRYGPMLCSPRLR